MDKSITSRLRHYGFKTTDLTNNDGVYTATLQNANCSSYRVTFKDADDAVRQWHNAYFAEHDFIIH